MTIRLHKIGIRFSPSKIHILIFTNLTFRPFSLQKFLLQWYLFQLAQHEMLVSYRVNHEFCQSVSCSDLINASTLLYNHASPGTHCHHQVLTVITRYSLSSSCTMTILSLLLSVHVPPPTGPVGRGETLAIDWY